MLNDFNIQLADCLSKMSDGSLKVGIQGFDSNRWRISEILPLVAAYNDLNETLIRETGTSLPAFDIWGGGQVSQVPRFLGEDPYINLSKMKELGPSLKFKCIYRGRQAFGFLPCSQEIQLNSIFEAASRGMQVFRMFDPMNDERNLASSLKAIQQYKSQQIADGISVDDQISAEALVFYVSPPKDTPAVWSEDQIIQYAVTLAKMGFDEISIADYADQVKDEEIIQRLVREIKTAFEQQGLEKVKVNVFLQGDRPEILEAALEAGADTVDVAFGDLSGGLSNPDIFDLLRTMMAKKGFDIDSPDFSDNPILDKLHQYRKLIDRFSIIHKPYRLPFNSFSSDEIADSKLAFNAVSALYSAVEKNWDGFISRALPDAFLTKHGPNAMTEYIKTIFQENYNIWKAGGQFNLVSPFGFISSFQAEAIAREKLNGRKLAVGQYKREFRDLLKGRYGKNIGVLQGNCDNELVKSFHIYEVLQILKKNIDTIPQDEVSAFLQDAGLDFISIEGDQEKGFINLREIEHSRKLEDYLITCDIENIRTAITNCFSDTDFRSELLFALSHSRFPMVSEGLEEGIRLVESLEIEGFDFSDSIVSHEFLSERQRAALIMVLFKVNESNPYHIGQNLQRYLKSGETNLIGDIEPNNRPIDKLFSEEILKLAEILAKRQVLESTTNNPLLAKTKRERSEKGLVRLKEREKSLLGKVIIKLEAMGYSANSEFSAFDMTRALSTFDRLSEEKSREISLKINNIPPLLWRNQPTRNTHSLNI